jgi:integrase
MPKITNAVIKTAYGRRAAALAANPRAAYREVLRDADLRGLSLTLNRTSETWTYSYKPSGTEQVETSPGVFVTKRPGSRHIKIGDLGSLGPDEARAEAAKLKLAVTAKQDPAADRRAVQQRRETTAKRASCASLLAPYEAHLRSTVSRKTRRKLGERHITAEIANLRGAFDALRLAELPPDQITSDHVADITMKANGAASARHWHGSVVRFLGWCQQQRRIASNPARDVPLPPAPPSRSRWLNPDELQAVWQGTFALDPTFGAFVRFLMCVPARRDEATNLRWSALDLKNATWSQAAEDVKNAQPHRFSLHGLALGVVHERLDAARQPGEGRDAALKRLVEEDALVFPTPRSGTPISCYSRIIAQLHKASGTSGWSLHDLRRTFASHCGEAGLALDIIDQCLNHAASASRGGVLGVYQRSQRWPQQQAAMAAWGNILSAFVGAETAASNVVALNAVKGA